jgi:hypothetical protein
VSVRSRLEALEGRTRLRRRVSEGSTRTRADMLEHLCQMARLKRGELEPEEAAEVESYTAAVERQFALRRGEGGR